jgi:hypothetical protein
VHLLEVIAREYFELAKSSTRLASLQVAVDAAALLKADEIHLVALVNGIPIHHTLPNNDSGRRAVKYVERNLDKVICSSVDRLFLEARLEAPNNKETIALMKSLAHEAANLEFEAVLERRKEARKFLEKEERTYKPILKRHRRRMKLIRCSLDAIAEIRAENKRKYYYSSSPKITQREVARRIFRREDYESAEAQYCSELRRARVDFSKLLKVNKAAHVKNRCLM